MDQPRLHKRRLVIVKIGQSVIQSGKSLGWALLKAFATAFLYLPLAILSVRFFALAILSVRFFVLLLLLLCLRF